LITPASAINATLYDNLNFNFIRDIAPVAGIIRVPYGMTVHPSISAKTTPEFISFAKANPGIRRTTQFEHIASGLPSLADIKRKR
jgi:tripartite-type tricarboxylate transporter receptor subunit TctC